MSNEFQTDMFCRMVTNSKGLFSKQHSFGTENSQINNNDSQYSNLNLNQNFKSSNDASPVHSYNKSFNAKSFDYVVSESRNEKEKSELWNESSKTSHFSLFNDESKEVKKGLKKGSTNNSTLSLHISAFEKSNETVASDSFLNKEGFKKNEQKQTFDSTFVIQNPFEFPRQQNSNGTDPEMSQYSASQRLFNPNKASNSSRSGMITPKFIIDQTDEHVIVEIVVPSARLEDADVEFSENLFIFSCKPYYLRLHFTNDIRSIDQEKDISKVISFDFEKSSVKIQMTKNVPGEKFGNFNDLKKLLNPSNASEVTELGGGLFNTDGEAVEEFLKQELPHHDDDDEKVESNEVIKKYGYGFAFKKHGELGAFKDELNDLFDIAKYIESFEIDKRSEFAHDLDLGKFDPQYFLADYYEPPGELGECIAFKFPDKISLTDADRDELSNIRKRELPKLDDMDLRHTLLGLLDILFAYAYDYKVNLGDSTCESSWTYVKLAPTFSCLACYETVREAFLSGIRRSLCYGLYRNWDFALSCVDEVEKIINQGPNAIIHCLLQIRKALAVEIHYRYLLNKLFVDDYIIFLQDLPSEDFTWLLIEISYVKKRLKINDTFMEYDLEECIKEAGLDALQITGAAADTGENEPLDSDDDDA